MDFEFLPPVKLNDCVIRAAAKALNIPYDEIAHQLSECTTDAGTNVSHPEFEMFCGRHGLVWLERLTPTRLFIPALFGKRYIINFGDHAEALPAVFCLDSFINSKIRVVGAWVLAPKGRFKLVKMDGVAVTCNTLNISQARTMQRLMRLNYGAGLQILPA